MLIHYVTESAFSLNKMVKVQRGQGEEEDGEVGDGRATEDEMSSIHPKPLNNWTKRDRMVLMNLSWKFQSRVCSLKFTGLGLDVKS